MRRARGLTVAAVLSACVAIVAIGWASWSVTGSVTGSSKAFSLPVPAEPSAVVAGTDVTVSWSQVSLNGVLLGSQTGGGYFIERYAEGSSTSVVPASACDVKVSGAGTTLSCVESSVPAGSWQYTLTSALQSWRSLESTKSSVAVIDGTPPGSTVTFPQASYNDATWTAGCSSPAADDVCGTASDTGSGVQKVEVAVGQSGGSWWNPATSTFDSASPVFMLASGTGSWSLSFAATNFAEGSHLIRTRATDNVGNVQSPLTTQAFVIDRTAPTKASVQMFDANPRNGRIDQVKVTFNEDVTCAGACTAPWSFANMPSGWSFNSASVSGAVVTLNLSEPASGFNTRFTNFGVGLSAAGGISDSAGNASSFASVPADDKASPYMTAIQKFDTNATPDGKIDLVIVSFSETVTCSPCGSPSPWTFGAMPAGWGFGSASATSNVVSISLSVPAGATYDTAFENFTVSLASGAVSDTATVPNTTSLSAAATIDKAKPIAIALSLTNKQSGTSTKPEEGDSVAITFSERLAASSLCSTWTSNSITQTISANAGGVLSVANDAVPSGIDVATATMGSGFCGGDFRFGSLDLGSSAYVNTNTVTFGANGNASDNGSFSWDPTTRTLTIVLGKKAGTGTVCTSGCPATSTAVYTPDATNLTDIAGNNATGTRSSAGAQF